MSNDKIKEIQIILKQFNDAYVEQGAKKIDEFLAKFHTTGDDSIIIGTSYKEWMYGLEGAKEIFLSDWNSPGVWSYNHEEAKISVKDSVDCILPSLYILSKSVISQVS